MEIYEATLEDAARMEEIVFLAGGNTLHDWSLSDHELGEVRNYDRLQYSLQIADPWYIATVVKVDNSALDNRDFFLGKVEIPDKLIIGFAVWERLGDSPNARAWQERQIKRIPCNEAKKLMAELGEIEDQWQDEEWSAESRMAKYTEDDLRVKKCYFSGSFGECFFLRDFATDPNWQGKGVATILVQWAKDHAQNERACLGTIAPESSRPFLTRQGFRWLEMFRVEDQLMYLGGLTRAVWGTPILGTAPTSPSNRRKLLCDAAM